MAAEPIPQNAEEPLDQSVLLSLVGYNCRRATVTLEQIFHRRMAKYDLRPVDFSILSLLKANPNINQKRLSDAIKVSPPNLAPLLDRLEARGLLARQRNPQDKRSQTLVLTPEGLRLCTKAEKTSIDSDIESTSALTDKERELLKQLLQKIFF